MLYCLFDDYIIILELTKAKYYCRGAYDYRTIELLKNINVEFVKLIKIYDHIAPLINFNIEYLDNAENYDINSNLEFSVTVDREMALLNEMNGAGLFLREMETALQIVNSILFKVDELNKVFYEMGPPPPEQKFLLFSLRSKLVGTKEFLEIILLNSVLPENNQAILSPGDFFSSDELLHYNLEYVLAPNSGFDRPRDLLLKYNGGLAEVISYYNMYYYLFFTQFDL